MLINPAATRSLKLIQEQGTSNLAASITKAASKQSYYIVSLLVDPELVPAAYQAYAYYRWVDDCLDLGFENRSERHCFMMRQRSLLERSYRGDWPSDITIEEGMLVDLIRNERLENGGLQSYLRNMMAVMEFDAKRRGSLISQKELTTYTRHLAFAVTDALHYFIGNGCFAPGTNNRHLAASGAHIAHMLRDTMDDLHAGYYNIPREVLEEHQITPWEVTSAPYRDWVRGQVNLARTYFESGREYLSTVENLRCRIAGHTYIGRFEPVLDAIERDGFYLRREYSEYRTPTAGLKMGLSALGHAIIHKPTNGSSHAWTVDGNYSQIEARKHEL